ncbi:MAG: CAP domain-containing protein [Thermoleophilaceae bacterium]|nr:CAP domain-containing protein [Thermoleophilaceae bacterium]
MRRSLAFIAAVTALFALPAEAGAIATECANFDLSASKSSIAKVEAAVARLVNEERTSRGLNALKRDAKLGRAARGHSKDMATRRYFDHDSPSGRDPGDRIAAASYRASFWGENIFLGLRTAGGVMGGWMASQGHCTNILSPDALDIGGGTAVGRSPLWTQVFGRASSANTPSAPSRRRAAARTRVASTPTVSVGLMSTMLVPAKR